jgi:predicted acetyltransferase
MASQMELVHPSASLRDSYRALVAEFVSNNEKLVPFTLSFPHDDFAAMLAKLAECSRGIGLPDGFVAHSTFWLVEHGAEVVGVSNLRHALTSALRRDGGNIGYGVRPSARGRGLATKLLRLTLLRARTVGLKRVLLTCAKENIASARTILRNGGVLESEEFLPDRSEVVQRYWIEIPADEPV